MDTIVPVTVKKVAKLVEAFESRGIGNDQIQAVLDNLELLNRVTALMAPPLEPPLDLSGQFDKGAMQRLIGYLYKRAISSARTLDQIQQSSPDEWEWELGCKIDDLATTTIMKDLLEGLSERHVAVAVLRSGLLDGREVPVNEVVQRLGLVNAKQVSLLRAQANAHLKARQASVYPIGRWVRKSTKQAAIEVLEDQSQLTAESLLGNVRFSTRTYNVLHREGIRTVGDLLRRTRTELADFRNLNDRSLDEIELVLDGAGLHLRRS